MYLKNESLYVSGLVNMASFNIGASYMQADCFKLNNYLDAFSKKYKISKDIINLKEEKISIEELFKEILNLDKNQTNNFIYWLETETGKCNKIYTIENSEFYDKLSGEYNGISGFYFVEEAYFIEFDKMFICFMIGNNE